MEIKDTLWFNTPAGQRIGIVKGTGQDGETRYYIGTGTGIDEGMDKEYIVSRGTPVVPLMIQSFFQLESKATTIQVDKLNQVEDTLRLIDSYFETMMLKQATGYYNSASFSRDLICLINIGKRYFHEEELTYPIWKEFKEE